MLKTKRKRPTLNTLIPSGDTRDTGRMGPAMRALNERQRAFVHAMIDSGMLNHTRCAMVAGYNGTDNALRVTAHRLAHDENVQAAIQEEARKRITSGGIMAVNMLLSIAENPVHKDQLKAVEMILNRSGLHALSEHKITVENKGATPADVVREIKALASGLGLDPRKLLGHSTGKEEPVDVEFEEAEESDDGREGLEDLL